MSFSHESWIFSFITPDWSLINNMLQGLPVEQIQPLIMSAALRHVLLYDPDAFQSIKLPY